MKRRSGHAITTLGARNGPFGVAALGCAASPKKLLSNVSARRAEYLWIQRITLSDTRDFDLLNHITTSPNPIETHTCFQTTSTHRNIFVHSLDETYTYSRLLHHQLLLNVTSLNNKSPPYQFSGKTSCLISKKPVERTAPWSRLLFVEWVRYTRGTGF